MKICQCEEPFFSALFGVCQWCFGAKPQPQLQKTRRSSPRKSSGYREVLGVPHRLCTWCDQWLPLADFGPPSSNTGGYPSRCVTCTVAARYGVSRTFLQNLLVAQDFRCGICGGDIRSGYVVDHDHSCCARGSCGKCIRGLLHAGCNSGLGLLGDDEEGLLRALAYLRKPVDLLQNATGKTNSESLVARFAEGLM